MNQPNLLEPDNKEIAKFSAHSADWWREDGAFKPLHRLNNIRLSYIRQQLAQYWGEGNFQGRTILDVGCGGGLATLPLARLAANQQATIIGIDPDVTAIAAANKKAMMEQLDVSFITGNLLDAAQWPKADAILALEVIEHVPNPQAFVQSLSRLLKPDGVLILSTLNRTPLSWLMGIAAAEYLLQWVPKGTHEWKKFITPAELAQMIRSNAGLVEDITGIVYHPLRDEFILSKNRVRVNYLMTTRF
ncbi:MAG: bifunctional 2-polyprenyl-6-hydroxyphenol methylase/3-demethylubiquinol 3-O-methyltransferase UbiG [Alphaproteobacteria bacterium]